ncbi:MAG: type I restriction-modification system subunit M N-terminal domain-containing protein, partial [candidate division WOR-3 bacterium]|nr:type I restriction-modification system subunit M N-terminal domain-containing protein [candidate division WOR-3 bacterium]
MARTKNTQQKNVNGANVGFEAQLWQAADKLRGVMDAAEYKHVVLGLIFLKYVSDAFAERYAALDAATRNPKDRDYYTTDEKQREATLEDRDEYLSANVFWVPPEARWFTLQRRAREPLIGRLLDAAMEAVERDNPKLKGVLPKIFGREQISKATLGGLIDIFANVGLGDKESRSKDVLGRVYEYFLGQFAS